MSSVLPVSAASKAHRNPLLPPPGLPASPSAPLEGGSVIFREGGGVKVFALCFADPTFPLTQGDPATFAQERMAEVAPNF